ncbi:hypothetical protein Dimus_029726 [Dionaea muscipula]
MSGYPQNRPDYGYGYGGRPGHASSPPHPYGPPPPYGYASAPPYTAFAPNPYGAPSAPYAPQQPEKPHKENKPYGGSSTYASSPGKPPKEQSLYGGASSGPPNLTPSAPYGPPMPTTSSYPPPYGSPFASLVPSAFPPGTDPNIVACFQMADQDGSGLIDDKELQGALSSYDQSFSLRTVHLLMYNFTNTNSRKIGPKEFTPLFYSLQNWRAIFERFDRDRSGKIDTSELREALLSLGFAVSPHVLDLLVSKFDKTGGRSMAIEYDNFIECCLTVKGLTEKFKAKDSKYSGSATFSYEEFMLTVLPFLIA